MKAWMGLSWRNRIIGWLVIAAIVIGFQVPWYWAFVVGIGVGIVQQEIAAQSRSN